jgi:multicomponent Na+:H+ antiporter subunit D
MGGSWSKWYLTLGSVDADQLVLVAILMISSLLNIAYLMPIPARGFFSAPPEDSEHRGIKEAPLFCVVPLWFTAVGCLVLFFFADDIYRLLAPLAQP